MPEQQESSAEIAHQRIVEEHFRDEINKTDGSILRIKPPTIRKDEGTGERARPLLYLQGMNGDKKLPWQLIELTASEQREIIAITFDKLIGTTKIIPTAAIDPETNDVPEVDKILADTITAQLVRIQAESRIEPGSEIKSFDMLTDSWGANRGAVALANRPDLFSNVLLVHPTGQDATGYADRHLEAVRQLAHHKLRTFLGKVPDNRERRHFDSLRQLLHYKTTTSESTLNEAEPEEIKLDKSSFNFRRLLDKRLDKRKVQKSVARAHLSNILGDIAQKYPDKNIIIAGEEHHDKAILPQRLLASKGAQVKFMFTNWGRHSIGYNRGAIQQIGTTFRHAEAGTLQAAS